MNRRELLLYLLGAPVAAAACKRHRSSPFPAGEFVFRDEVRGHTLRSPFQEEVPVDKRQHSSVVIVGAGIAGLAAAWRLRKARFVDFTILELAQSPGGTARSGQSQAGAHPWGAHYITAPLANNQALVTLLGEMSALESDAQDDHGNPVVSEAYLCRDPEQRIFYRGRWYEGLFLSAGASARDLDQFAQFQRIIGQWAQWRDARGRRAFASPIVAGSDDAEVTALDKLSMAEWMRQHGLTSPRVTWYVNYACRDDYGTTAENVSAWAGIFYFASRLAHEQADYQPVVTWPAGNGAIVAHLYKQVKQQTRLGRIVRQIRPEPGNHDSRPHVDVVSIRAPDGSAESIRAEQVIYCAPQFLRPYLIRDTPEDVTRALREFDYGPWMVANLHTSARPTGVGFPLSWDNVLYDSPSLGYVVSTHQTGADHGPTTLTYYYPLVESNSRRARARLVELGWREWAEGTLSDLERAHRDLGRHTTRIDIARYGHAMIRPRPGFVWGNARLRAAEPDRGVYFANTDLSGVGLFEEAFYHGIRAAEQVLAARHIPSESLL